MAIVLREKCKKLFVGDVTLKKKELWMVAFTSVLLGIVIGFLKAPLTHGITISCGNNSGNTYAADAKENKAEQDIN